MNNYVYRLFVTLGIILALASCKKKVESNIEQGVRAFAPTGQGTQWYVAANGVTTNSGLSPSSPKGSLREVAELTEPGDVVNIMSTGGEFKRIGTQGSLLSTTKSGLPGQYITYRGYPVGGPKPVLRGYGMYNTIALSGVSYIKIENLEVIGDMNGQYGGPALTKAAADAVYDRVRPIWLATNTFTLTEPEIAYQTSGIFTSGNCHHIEIRGCKVHDLPGTGIATNFSDYIIIEDNNVYNTSSLSIYGMSGISYLRPYNFDGHGSGYSIIIRRNTCYYNKSIVKCYHLDRLTDGNGIICDVSTGYTGRTLVENNISFKNGGGGIHCVTAINVDVVNNTAYSNGQVLAYAEMDASYGSKNVRFTSNIMSAKPGGKCIDNSYTDNGNVSIPNVNIVYFKNVLHNGSYNPTQTGGLTNTDFRTGNPQFISAVDGTPVNLRLDPTKTPVSSAANFGSGITGYFSIKDISGVTRISNGVNGKYPDCGAYENFN